MSKQNERKTIKISFVLTAEKDGTEKWSIDELDAADYEEEVVEQIWDAAEEMAKIMTEEEARIKIRDAKEQYNLRVWERQQRGY